MTTTDDIASIIRFVREVQEVVGEAAGDDGPKLLGKDPYTDEEITLRSGRFGPYVQRGDGKEAKRQMALLPAFVKYQAGEAKTAKALAGR